MARRFVTLSLLCAGLWSSTFSLAQSTAVSDDQAASPSAQPVNPVVEWNRTLLQMVRTPNAQPSTIHSTRDLAILHVAIFDAVNSIDRSFQPYAVRLPHVSRRASTQAAADQAAHDV